MKSNLIELVNNVNILVENNLECEISFTFDGNSYEYIIGGAEYVPCFYLYKNNKEIMRLCINIPTGDWDFAFSQLETEKDFEVVEVINYIFNNYYELKYFSRSPRFVSVEDMLSI